VGSGKSVGKRAAFLRAGSGLPLLLLLLLSGQVGGERQTRVRACLAAVEREGRRGRAGRRSLECALRRGR